MKLLFITLILLGLAIAGIAIKLWAKKDGKFAGTCASQNPMLNKEGESCGFCGKTPDQFSNCNEPQHSSLYMVLLAILLYIFVAVVGMQVPSFIFCSTFL